jgi:hypothetical protein
LETRFDSDVDNEIVFYAGNSDNTKDETEEMAAKLYTFVKVEDQDGNAVNNFSASCYAEDVDIALTYLVSGEDDIVPVIMYDDENASTANSYAPSQSAIISGENSIDLQLKKEAFKEGEGSQIVRINFHRDKNIAYNPMRMQITDVNASLTGTTLNKHSIPEHPSKTFLYLKAHVSSPQVNVGKVKDVTVNYEFYRDEDADLLLLESLGLDSAKESEDEVNWFIIDPSLSSQLNYNFTTHKPKALGSRTIYSSYGGPSALSAGTTLIERPNSSTIRITTPKLPYHDKIVYSPEKEFLKYDRFNASVNVHTFKVHFVSDKAKWTGKGSLGMRVDEKVAAGNSIKKIDW